MKNQGKVRYRIFQLRYEGWTFGDGLFYVLADITSLPNPLVNNSPVTTGAIAVSVFVSLIAMALSSFVLGLAASLPLPALTLRPPHAQIEATETGT